MHELQAEPHNVTDMLRDAAHIFEVDDWVVYDRAGPRHFRGRLIGIGTSQREQHSHYADHGDRERHPRCTACRWSEIFIFQVKTSLEHGPFSAFRYCVYTIGASILRGENTRANVRWATSGFEVMELATVRRGDRGAPFLPAAHARALAMAAEVDDAIADAYVNRAVA